MREPEDRRRPRTEITPQEFDLIAKVARAFRTAEGDELQAELARRVLDLKTKPISHIRDWKAYLAKFLYNKASDWVRAQRSRERRQLSIDAGDEEEGRASAKEPREQREPDPLLAPALLAVWEELDPNLRRFWEALVEAGGNQSVAARRLGIHRNTARSWRRRIVETLRAHGLEWS